MAKLMSNGEVLILGVGAPPGGMFKTRAVSQLRVFCAKSGQAAGCESVELLIMFSMPFCTSLYVRYIREFCTLLRYFE